MYVNSANLFQIAPPSAGGGSVLQNNTTGGDDLIYVTEVPSEVVNLINDGNWLAFTAGWLGAPPGLLYINMDNVAYFTANPTNGNAPEGSVLYWAANGGNYQVANVPGEIIANVKRL
ncbi:hypothetical protein [Mycolicibacter kumamotonensis]|uniref:Uncharacterized protein n=1 Tax=Mycolicibacter kumamotonensis TaxID=354243 RepID=A0A1B8SL89_9MYCO|nr:hypothetical protein [Mycolicibacter kumamotonensis]OBY33477.1 hypothetical protein ACT18_00575 [Mycolicibacter kumamotonensis]